MHLHPPPICRPSFLKVSAAEAVRKASSRRRHAMEERVSATNARLEGALGHLDELIGLIEDEKQRADVTEKVAKVCMGAWGGGGGFGRAMHVSLMHLYWLLRFSWLSCSWPSLSPSGSPGAVDGGVQS